MSGHERFAFKSREEFLAKIAALSLEIPFSHDIGGLFRSFPLAGRTLPNRLAVHPLEGADAGPGGAPGELTFRRYRRFAESGCGLIWFEATALHEEGRSNPNQLLLSKQTLDAFKRLVEMIRSFAQKRAGRNPSPVLILQLTHTGRFSKPRGASAPIIAQHNPHLDPLHKIPPDHPLISDRELDDLQDIFARAAGMAAEAGFDGVDIKACHGYLVSELLASRSRENSRYGGSFDNRTRFLRETTAKIKTGVPNIIIASRLGLYDSVPCPYGFGTDEKDAANSDLSEPVALVKKLSKKGLTLLNITAGIPAYRPHYGRPFDKPVRGGSVPDEHPLTGVSRLVRLASRLQKEFPSLAVVGTGYSWLRRFFPHVAAGVLTNGGASLIGVGRLAYAYPDFAWDLMDKGALDPRKLCLACSGCSTLLRAGGPVGCLVRDKTLYRLPR